MLMIVDDGQMQYEIGRWETQNTYALFRGHSRQ